MKEKEAYSILNLSAPVTDEEVNKAFRELAMQYHPDQTGGETTEEFRRIMEARHTLLDSSQASSSGTSSSSRSQETSSTTQETQSTSGTGSESTDTGESHRHTQQSQGQHSTSSQTAETGSKTTNGSKKEDVHDEDDEDTEAETENVDESPSRGNSVYQVDFSSLEDWLRGKTVRIKGSLRHVHPLKTEGANYKGKFYPGSEIGDPIDVYVWADIGHRSLLTGSQQFNLTGVVRKDWQGTGWELHVVRVDDIERVSQASQGQKADTETTTEQSNKETEGQASASSGNTTDTTATDTGQDSSESTSTSVGVTDILFIILGGLLLPGQRLNTHSPWYISWPLQIGAVLAIAFGLTWVQAPTIVLDTILVLSFIYLPVGGVFTLTIVGFEFVTNGEQVIGAVSLLSAVLLIGVYFLFRLTAEA